MLQFRKLVLSGFKSFIDPTELLIEPGMTGVVGPNGCGKSNLLEAMRWVMGESSAKRMRGGEMDDVIFGGSEGRPARNLAEVKLVIDNSAHEAPAIFNEFDELEISRRIEREKGSRYKVNGKDNRARDVQLLFADAGSGAQSNSLVGQGRIGAIIGAKPTERRVLLEEAAGIAGLYSRRHEAELRLRAAETNLTRLDDIQETLHAQLRSLARQAKQAERYRALNEELRKLEAIVFHLDWIAFSESLEAAKAAVRQGQRGVGEATQAASAAEREAIGANARIKDARELDAVAAAVLQRLEHERENLEAERKRQIGAREELEKQVGRLREDRTREVTLLEEASTTISRLEQEKVELVGQGTSDDELKAAALEKVAGANKTYTSEQADLDSLTQQKATMDAERQASQKAIYDLESQGRTVEQRLQKATLDKNNSTNRLATLEAAEPENSSEQLEKQIQQTDGQISSFEERRDTLHTTLEAQRGKLRDLETSQKSHEAEVRGVKAALAASERSTSKTKLAPVLDLLSVKSGFEAALAAALGEDLDAPLFESGAERFWHSDQNADLFQNLPNNLPSLATYVQAPEALASRLNNIAVIEDATQGSVVAKQLKPGQRLVSLRGDLWRWDGYQESHDYKGASSLAETRLKQRNRLETLADEIAKTQPLVDEAKRQLNDLSQERQQVETQLGQARQTKKQLENELSSLRQRLAQTATERAQLKGQLENLNQQIEDLGKQQAELKAALEKRRSEVQNTQEAERLTSQVNDKRAKVSEARLALSQSEGERDRLTYEQEQRSKRISGIASDLASWANRKLQADQRKGQFNERLSTAEKRLEEVRSAPDVVGGKLTKLAVELDKATTDRKAKGDALSLAETEQLRLTKAEKDAERGLSDARENLVRAEAQVEQIDERIRDLSERIREKLAVAPQHLLKIAALEEGKELPARNEAESRRQRALAQREAMGPVNLRAEKESTELTEELSKYETEREDVQKAVTTLREAIEELNSEGREKLLVAFDEVNRHFQHLFKRLFGGGEAELKLVDSEDPLEAGLQVLASPPGKRMQILSLLSGGEQALTAMSLLFAVFMTKPAPVCVLDEVDAPLDDENCIRFCDLIRDMAKETGTRFLVVTHNPHTMARVDRLFGVTMAEKGVSQLMSVNLRTAEKLVK